MRRAALLIAGVVVIGGGVWLGIRLLAPGPAAPPDGPVVARVEARPDTTRIGRPVEVLYEVRTPAEFDVAFAPKPVDDSLWTWQQWELQRSATSSEGIHHRLRAVGLPFRTGPVAVPAPSYKVTPPSGEAATGGFPTVTVQVVSVLPADDLRPDIRGLKPPLTVPWWMTFPWWIVAVVLLAIALAIWAWKKLKKKAPEMIRRRERPDIRIPAHVEALRELDELVAEGLPEKSLWYQHQTRLADIVRRFLENRFNTPRTSLTTRELCLHLVWRDLSGTEVERLRVLLRVADLAKFARSQPSIEDSHGLEEECRALILTWADQLHSVETSDDKGAESALRKEAS